MINHLYKSFLHRVAISALALVVTGGFFVSCSDELDIPKPLPSETVVEAGYLSVSLRCGNHSTRAEEPGIDDLNENRITSVTLCLSPSAGDRTDEDAPVFMHTFTDLDSNSSVILRVPLTPELVTRLFNENSDSECRIFAAVNVNPGSAATVAQLRAMAVTSDFATTQKQNSFTMDGDGIVKYSSVGNYAVGEVTVKRSAAKITLALNVDSEVEEVVGEETLKWTPNLEGMKVRLQQGVMTSTLDPAPSVGSIPDNLYFNTPDNLNYDFKEVTRPSEDKYAAYNREQAIPFYTYPNKWTGSIDERHGTFMMLSVPWSPDGGTTWRTCYYHVPIIPFDKFELVRNVSYHVNLHVGVLGSFVPEEPLEVEGDYYVADWGNEVINVDIKDYRYLVVDQNDYVVNNETSTSIPFYTSHETIVTDVKMKFYRYNFSDQGSEFAVEVSMDQNRNSEKQGGEAVYECEFNNSDDTLTLSHILDVWTPYNISGEEVSLITRLNGERDKLDNLNAIKDVLSTIDYFVREKNDTEYSRIEYEVTVQHKDVADGTSGIDKNLYKETVTITQYPGMYITAIQNAAGLLGEAWASGAYGNTIINGRYDDYVTYNNNNSIPTSGPSDQRKLVWNYMNWDYSLGLSSGFLNWNPNLYLVTITQLSPDTEFTLGDPRSYNINNYLDNNDVDSFNDKPWQTEYWERYYDGNWWNIRKIDNPTQDQINKIKDGVTTTGKLQTWTQGYILDGFTTAPAINETTQRTLKYYYPTRESMDNQNTVAPKFRICSSYGGTWAYLTRSMARRRAAAYQEIGYCAGRWRLPTFGEVRYIMELSRQNKIPRLFGRDEGVWYYWCAQGAVLVPARGDTETPIRIVTNPGQDGNPPGGNTAIEPFVGNNFRDHGRFVYDEWYWGEGTLTPSSATPNQDTPTYTFTWGDQPKSNPQE